MKQGPRFSIRYKFLAVTTVLLVFCVGIYLILATEIYKSDKNEFVFDYHRSLVSNLATDVDTLFQGVTDKARLTAYFFREEHRQARPLIEDLLKKNSHMVYVAASSDFSSLDKEFYVDQPFLKTYGLGEDFFKKGLIEKRPIPYLRLQEKGEAVWAATLPDGAPLIGFGKNVIEENEKGQPVAQFAVIVYVHADQLLQSVQDEKQNEVAIVASDGQVLVHADSQTMSGARPFQSELLAISQKSPVQKGVQDYLAADGQRHLGAFARARGGQMIVLSTIASAQAFAVVDRLVYRSMIFASIVVTLAFLAAILFSRSLTKPIERLVAGMKKVSQGDLTTRISVKSQDEIASLADSFNLMIIDLESSRRELEEVNRDLERKVKDRTKDLEDRNRAVKEAQEALLKSTRLAAVGEVAGQAAHEVLNPLTSIINRTVRVSRKLQEDVSAEISLLSEICSAWRDDYSSGGIEKLMQSWKQESTVKTGASLLEEDLANLQVVEANLESTMKSLVDDTGFVLQESQRISRIVNSMRSMSAIKGDLVKVPVFPLCQQSVAIMEDLAQQKGIEIAVENLAKANLAMVDEDEFIQVMTNLIRNSIQSMDEKIWEKTEQPKVIIRMTNSEEQLFIRVIDNGAGISTENQNKLFKAQFSTKPKSQGTGIGLNISRRLTRAFRGDLTLESSVQGRGAVFLITLPLATVGEERLSA